MITNTFKKAGKDNNATSKPNPYLDDALLMDIAKGVQNDQIKVNELKREPIKNELNNDNKMNDIINKVTNNNENINVSNTNTNTSINKSKNTFEESKYDDIINDFKIGTRKSNLAMFQANLVRELMVEYLDNTKTYEVVGIKTKGDKDTKTPLSHFSLDIICFYRYIVYILCILNNIIYYRDKGIFTKELDIALLNNEIHCAVHCIKDLPTKLPSGLEIGCYLKRGIPNDCCLVNKNKYPNVKSMRDLPKNSVIGTSSLRRKALIYYNYGKTHSFKIKDIRGNLDTRLRKLMNDEYDAILLAKIGVERLKWINNKNLTIIKLKKDKFPYAVGQAGLGIVINSKNIDVKTMLHNNKINDITCEIQCIMERTLLSILEGGCKVPIGCTSNIYNKCPCCGLLNNWDNKRCQACLTPLNNDNNQYMYLYLYSCVLTQNGSNKIEYNKLLKCPYNGSNKIDNLIENAKQIGINVANELKSKGAMNIINDIKSSIKTSIKH